MSIRNTQRPFPPVSELLLKELNERFPEKTPEIQWSDRDIWVAVGQRLVVRFLNDQFARQNETILNNQE